ncbi:MAG: sulfotransferase domain-containing protein [Planctomycetales bacterium]
MSHVAAKTAVDFDSTDTLKEGIVWLASYPKSGNTWFRIFLKNLMARHEDPAKLQGIGCSIASARSVFDDLAGIDSSEMSHDEIDWYRAQVYEQIASEARSFPIFMKTHDAYTYLASGEPMLSRKATAGGIYFVRNPLDVAVSFAYHSGHNNFDRTITEMGSRECGHFCHGNKRLFMQLRQLMFGWSGHVESWTQSDAKVHVMRYEDMKANPQETFSGAIQFTGLDYNEEDVTIALEKSKFENLQQMEQEDGFREKAVQCTAFFRKGSVGSWREKLNEQQVERIITDHGKLMKQFGYLDENNQPVF